MASKKAKTPQEQALIKKRVEFVQSKPDVPKAQARQQFFVQTRAAELQAKGVEVTKEKRAQLRQKFQSGDVSRSGFYTDADRARFAAGKSGKGSSSSTVTSNGQNLAEYKMLGKENTARRPVAAKPSSNGNFLSGAANLAKRGLEDIASAPLIKFVTGQVNSTLESTAATFINPSINLVGSGLNKLAGIKDGQKGDYNPNLRVAGPKEAAINTAFAVIDIASAGQSAAYRAAYPTFFKATKPSAWTRLNNKIDELDNALDVRSGRKSASVIENKVTGKVTGPVASGAKKSNVTQTGPGGGKSFWKNVEEGRAQTYKGQKPGSVDLAPGVKPVKATSNVKPASTRTRSTVGKTKTQAQMQREADNAVSGGLSKVMNDAPVTKGPDMNSSNLTFVESKPASVAKPAAAKAPKANTRKPSEPRPAPKTTRAKAEAGKNFNQKVKQVNSGPQTKINSKIKKYESQEAFDKFMNTGGKDIVVEATRANPKVGKMFTDANEEFIKTRSARSTSQATVRASRADRRVKAAIRLNRIRANQAAKAAGK
jgi:hypothetical protein